MDLANPLASLIPSLDSAALEVLSGVETGLGTSRIQRLAGRGSRQGLQLVLDRLVDHGLVLAEPSNTGYLYSLNYDHLLASAILDASRVRTTLLSRLRDHLSTFDPLPIHGSVFGSLARGEGTPSSDIDLFLFMPMDYDLPEGRWEHQIQELGELVLRWTGNNLETLVLDPVQLAHAMAEDEGVLESIAAEGISLLGPSMDDLFDVYHGNGRST